MLYQEIVNSEEYSDIRYEVLLGFEESGAPSLLPYVDPVGLPTIGAGFNLTDEFIRVEVFKVMGIDDEDSAEFQNLNEAGQHAERDYALNLTKIIHGSYFDGSDNTLLRGLLDSVMEQRANDPLVPYALEYTFQIGDQDEVRSIFDSIVESRYEQIVTDWIEQVVGVSNISSSNERLALLSLAYNSRVNQGRVYPSLLGDGLKNALQDDNRAEAWYEIRYNSNLEESTGIAKRRYIESELFGLYHDPESPTLTESVNVFASFQKHRDEILTYESKYGLLPNGKKGTNLSGTGHTALELANAQSLPEGLISDGVIDGLVESLESAKEVIINDLVMNDPDLNINPNDFISTNIYISQQYGDNSSTTGVHLKPVHNTNWENSEDDLVIGWIGNDRLHGGEGDDTLYGGKGNDQIYGDEGADYLYGGDNANGGYDVLFGGGGKDYIYGQAGQDIIQGGEGDDELYGGEGKDIYVYNDGDGNNNIYDTGENSLVINGKPVTWGVFVKDGEWVTPDGTITFNKNSPLKVTTASGGTLTIEDPNDTDLGINLAGSVDGLNVVSGPDVGLDGTLGRDKIIGGAGDDVLIGNAGDDYLFADGDIPIADAINESVPSPATRDWLTGGSGSDVLVGSAGENILLGGSDDDLIIGGTGRDYIGENKSVPFFGMSPFLVLRK